MKFFCLCALALVLALPPPAQGERITVAAAADLKFAMEEIVGLFEKANPGEEVEVIYGSSGKFATQIRQGAPYDLFFSADAAYPRALAAAGLAASEVRPYAVGRLVLWSASLPRSRLSLAALVDPGITRVAIANPKHAPYGQRAEEALRRSGLLEKVEPKLVFGENIAQTAQFVHTGNADVGIIALSLAKSSEMSGKGGYVTIPESLHAPLVQAYVVLRRAAKNSLAWRFGAFLESAPARAALAKHGFMLPAAGKPD